MPGLNRLSHKELKKYFKEIHQFTIDSHVTEIDTSFPIPGYNNISYDLITAMGITYQLTYNNRPFKNGYRSDRDFYNDFLVFLMVNDLIEDEDLIPFLTAIKHTQHYIRLALV